MSYKQKLGTQGEDMALSYLEEIGYIFSAKNYRFGHKEIDLIMKDGETIVFVEVKARSSNRFGKPEEAVTHKKRGNLLTAAQAYLAENLLEDHPARFDVIAIDMESRTVRHIKNAFIYGWD